MTPARSRQLRQRLARVALADDGYREYWDHGFLGRVRLAHHADQLKTFWPAGGPAGVRSRLSKLRKAAAPASSSPKARATRMSFTVVAAPPPRFLKGALSRLEGEVRSRVDGRRRRQRPVTQPATAPAPKATSPATSTTARAPRGENKKKILAALQGGPKTASEIATETGIKAGTVGASLSKLAKAGEVVKADRGYALPE
jgi:hypothetical protein